ncbi:hypothetical protein RQP46_000916 [Phenoliferia psychrophenolica]
MEEVQAGPTPFANQVAGHPNSILASPLSPATLIKPSSARELAFYTAVGPALHPDLIGYWTPAYFGTLTLQGKIGDGGQVEAVEDEGEQMLVLENLTYRFLRPNVLDIKLGTQLYDDDAPPEKQERMRLAAERTTSGTTGVRLTGFQVWDSTTSSFISTPKTYGKSLSSADLPSGIARFFAPHLASDSPPSPLPHPLPLPLLHSVLSHLLSRLQDLIDLFSTLECRIRGGSVLIVFEGDADALADALAREATSPPLKPVSSSTSDEEEEEDEEGDEDETSSISTTDSEGQAKPHTRLAVELRLIDFAHATR